VFRKIVFAHNGSSSGDRALLYVQSLGHGEGTEVVVVHAYEVPQQYATTASFGDLQAGFEAVANAVVEDAIAELETAGVQARAVVREGTPERVILQVAEEEKASLIVLGTRGPSSVAELLLGSVSTEVLRFARCPVLAVP
jgi:nucleotide-binding universal stress UspA family protein